jgi:hypothetical protein
MTGAQHRMRRRLRTDWFRVLIDLQYAGHSHMRVAKLLDVPEVTLRGWKAGSEPAHANGHNLLELWHEVTGKDVGDRPMVMD